MKSFNVTFIDNDPINHQLAAQGDEKKATEHLVRIDVLDFAGQIEYYITHQLFLSDVYCVYILVSALYGREGNGPFTLQSSICAERLRYWLSFISCLFDKETEIPALIALTHGDCGDDHHDARFYYESSKAESFTPPFHDLACMIVNYKKSHEEDDSKNAQGSKSISPKSFFNCTVSRVQNIWQHIFIPASYNSAEKAVLSLFNQMEIGKKLPILLCEELRKIVASSHIDLKENDLLCDRAMMYLVGTGILMQHNLSDHSHFDSSSHPESQLDSIPNDNHANENSNSNSNSNSSATKQSLFVLNPVGWFSSVLAMFVGDNFDQGNALVKCNKVTGIVSLSEIRKHQQSLRCADLTQLRYLMDVMEKIELCLRVSSGSNPNINSNKIDGYLFPCLLPVMSEHERKEMWHSVSSEFPLNMFGRRFQCENESQHLPSGFFPTLLHRVLSHMRQLVFKLKLNVCFLIDHNTGGCLMINLDAERAGEPRFIELVCCGSAKTSVNLLRCVFDLCESILHKYKGLSVSRFCICTRCLCSRKTSHCLHDCQSTPLLFHKEVDEKEVDMKDRCDVSGGPPHRFDCWTLAEGLNFICGKKGARVSNKELLHGLETITTAAERPKKRQKIGKHTTNEIPSVSSSLIGRKRPTRDPSDQSLSSPSKRIALQSPSSSLPPFPVAVSSNDTPISSAIVSASATDEKSTSPRNLSCSSSPPRFCTCNNDQCFDRFMLLQNKTDETVSDLHIKNEKTYDIGCWHIEYRRDKRSLRRKGSKIDASFESLQQCYFRGSRL